MIGKNKKKNLFISIIIPVYNEEHTISLCVRSLKKQSIKNFEIIVIDDGSSDNTVNIVTKHKVKLIRSEHKGPGNAKNIGVKNASGDILVFIDADMHVSKDYLFNLIDPIINKSVIGTYSTSEFIGNYEKIWSKCWNINNDILSKKRLPENYKFANKAFRAILKSKFEELGGFDVTKGYKDDMTLSSDHLVAYNAKKAISFHNNPETLSDVFISSRWIGRSIKLSVRNLVKYSVFNSLRVSLNKLMKGAPIQFILFKLIFDFGIIMGIIFPNKENNYAK